MPPARRWTDRLASDRALAVLAVVAALVAAGIFVQLARLRPPQSHLWGDEGTYVAMAASLARDVDFAFTEADRAWALARGGDPKGVAVILQRAGGRVTYSKPLLYPLLGALPYALLGEAGLLLVNALALAVGVGFAWLFLRRIASGGRLALTLVVFVGCAAVAPYLVWRMSECLQFGLALAGLALACGSLRPATRCPLRWVDRLLERPAAPLVGGALLGLLTSMRTSNALLLAGAALGCGLAGGRRRALSVGAAGAAALAAVLLLSAASLGTASPYTAARSSFNAKTGYPAGDGAGQALDQLDAADGTHRLRFDFSAVSLYSAYYFLAGRHTGLLAYFPLALVLAVGLARAPDRLALTLLATTLALATFYLVYMPHNYFGGSTFVGNRYFLVSYPALLVGTRRAPSPRLLAATLLVGLLFGASAVRSVERTRAVDPTSQSHAAAGAFLALPYESTAIEIQGQRSRFWSRDYVRFTTAATGVERRRFILDAKQPLAELMIASRLPRESLLFLVRPAAAVEAIAWRDWARSGVARPRGPAHDDAAVVSLRPATAWRRHRFWWRNDESYDVRLLRLELLASAPEARVELYYLGGDDALLGTARRTVVRQQLPARGLAGGRGRVRLAVRNTSDSAWSPDAVLPVMIGYRIHSRREVVASGRQPLPGIVDRGEQLEVDLMLDWPAAPGEYRLVVDLYLHPLYWFAQRLGEPLAARWVEIVPPATAGSPAPPGP